MVVWIIFVTDGIAVGPIVIIILALGLLMLINKTYDIIDENIPHW